jgi:hypothetical protein
VLPARVFSFVYTLIDEGFWELLTPLACKFLEVYWGNAWAAIVIFRRRVSEDAPGVF